MPHRPVTVYIFNDIIDGVFNFDPWRGSEFTDIHFANVLSFLSGSIYRCFFVILGKRPVRSRLCDRIHVKIAKTVGRKRR